MSLFASYSRRPSARPRRARRPAVEALEDRCTPSAGALDPSFGQGGITGVGTASADYFADVAAYPAGSPNAGKTVAVGGVITSGNWDFYTARINADGSLDRSFGTGGTVSTPFAKSNSDYAQVIALQADGKIVVAGTAYVTGKDPYDASIGIARYNADGSLDKTFNKTGMITLNLHKTAVVQGVPQGDNEYANGLAVQPDGKIVVSVNTNGAPAYLVRLQAGGQLDPTFDGDGIVNSLPDESGWASVLLQPDGKLVLGGRVGADHSGLWRFNANGSRDASFGAGGRAVLDINPIANDFETLDDVARQADGMLVASGTAPLPGGDGSRAVAVTRVTAAGQLDTTYASGGTATTLITTDVAVQSFSVAGTHLVIQPDGKAVVAAVGTLYRAYYDPATDSYRGAQTCSAALRLDGTGALDPTWGVNGVSFLRGLNAAALALQPDTKVVLAGRVGTTTAAGSDTYDATLARYLADDPAVAAQPTSQPAADRPTTGLDAADVLARDVVWTEEAVGGTLPLDALA